MSTVPDYRTQEAIKRLSMAAAVHSWIISSVLEAIRLGVIESGSSVPSAHSIRLMQRWCVMLSPEEINAISSAEKDLSPELQIVMLWLGRVTKKPADELLEGLRQTITDWQEYSVGPTRP